MLVLSQPTYACAGSVQNNPFSLYVVYSLLAHEQLGMWILSDIGRTLQMHSHLLELMDELCQDGPLETAWLSAACVTKTWHCEFVSYPKEAEEGRKIVNGFGRVHECLLDVLQVGPVLCKLCVDGKRTLLASLSALPAVLQSVIAACSMPMVNEQCCCSRHPLTASHSKCKQELE